MDKLPTELKLQILSYLDAEPPSVERFEEEPSLETWTRARIQPLKALSLSSRGWRQLVIPQLYNNFRLHLGTIYSGSEHFTKPFALDESIEALPNVQRLKAFIANSNLQKHITSLFVYSDKEWPQEIIHSETGKDCKYEGGKFWSAILPLMPHLQRLVVLASPPTIAFLIQILVNMDDAWAFDMPLKGIMLGKAPQNVGKESASHCSDHAVASQRRLFGGSYGNDVLDLYAWRRVSINEGSSLKAYSTYEYFHKQPPAIFCGLMAPVLNAVEVQELMHVTYFAIFPFADHFKLFFSYLPDLLRSLRSLSVQLAPLPASRLIEDPERVGKAQLGDCWLELERSYLHLGRRIGKLTSSRHSEFSSFRRFESLDYGHYDLIQEDLDRALMSLTRSGWKRVEGGVWTR